MLQITDGCDKEVLGRTSYLFSLSVDTLEGQPLRALGVTISNAGGSTTVPEVFVTGRGIHEESDINTSKNLYFCHAVQADIKILRTEPNSPIEGTDTSCLSAGSTVKIICENVAYPVATVEFVKDGTAIDTSINDRCECACGWECC